MHGAITADAFRVPWVPVRFATNFYEEKWRDFLESMNIVPDIEILPVMYQYRQPLWRLFRNSVKKAIFKVNPASGKWSKLPVARRLATDSELAHLASELKKIAQGVQGVLSDDAVVADVTRRLAAKVEVLKDDYQSGALFV
jgi:succinoglycan biosynthesis protein ExoV